MKVSPLSPATSVAQQEDVSRHDDSDAGSINRLKRRRLHSQTDIMIDGHYPRHRYPRRDDKSPSMDRFDAISNRVDGNSNSSYSSGNSGEEDASDCDDTSTVMADSNVYPDGQSHAQEGTSSPPPPHDKKDNTTIVNNNNTNTEGDCTTPAIRNAVQQLTTNDDNNSEKYKDIETIQTTFEPAISSSPVEHLNESETINEKNQRTTEETFDDPMAVVSTNHCVNSDNSNDGCLSQSPLNLTRSQGSSVEGGNKSEDDDEGEEFEDDSEGKNGFGNVINDNENIVNGINLPTTEVPFPWNMTSDINNKQKQQHRGDKISAQPPQLLLTSGQLTTGCLQAAQLLIPTARGIMTQTILAIPINDMAASAVTAPNANQQQLLQQQLLYHSSNNVRQKKT